MGQKQSLVSTDQCRPVQVRVGSVWRLKHQLLLAAPTSGDCTGLKFNTPVSSWLQTSTFTWVSFKTHQLNKTEWVIQVSVSSFRSCNNWTGGSSCSIIKTLGLTDRCLPAAVSAARLCVGLSPAPGLFQSWSFYNKVTDLTSRGGAGWPGPARPLQYDQPDHIIS